MTYPTYQAAKIAMPKACICVYEDNGEEFFFGMPSKEGTRLVDGVKFACPADHCMTVKQFLDVGHKFVDGDLMIGQDGLVIKVSSCPSYNKLLEDDDKRYVLRAKALEETKTEVEMNKITEFEFNGVSVDFSQPDCVLLQDDDVNIRVSSETFKELCIQYLCLECPDVIKFDGEPETKPTYRYEKVTDSIFDLKEEFERGELYADSLGVHEVQGLAHLGACAQTGFLYRRIEVTERELAVDAAIEIICRGSHDSKAAEHYRHWFEGLFDEGVLVRVNGKG